MKVYPRVGGGTFRPIYLRECLFGLSPRGRGNRPALIVSPSAKRSIPAWAGEPLPVPPGAIAASVYPRVGGGTSAISFATASL